MASALGQSKFELGRAFNHCALAQDSAFRQAGKHTVCWGQCHAAVVFGRSRRKMQAIELQCCQTARIAAAPKQGKHDLVQNAALAEGTCGALFLRLQALFFFYPSKPYSNGLTYFKHCEQNVLGTFALDCCDNQGIRKIANCNVWPLRKAIGGILLKKIRCNNCVHLCIALSLDGQPTFQ